jgi:putative membrane protein
MKRTIQGLLLAGSLVFGGTALAQGTQGATQGSPQGGTQGSMQGGTQAKVGKPMVKGGMVEHMGFMVPADEKAFLERLHHINKTEIQLGQLAQQNGQSQDVKSYGAMLVKDHTANDQQVMAYAQKKGHKLADMPKPLNDVESKAMTAEKAAMEKLQVLKGMPFDACFLAHMVGDHDMALGKVMAAQQVFTDTEVASLLQQTSQSVTGHRQQAYTLLGKNGPAMNMGVGGAGGDINQGMNDRDHGGHMGTGMGGTGDFDKGQSGAADDKKNTLDPGNKKKY